MFKKLQRNIVFLFMLFIIPLTIGTVNCSWTYYEGKIDDLSITLDSNNITLGEFNFLNPGFPDTPSGEDNSNALDHIVGKEDDPTSDGLLNPDSLLNDNLTTLKMPQSDFITSVDTVGPAKTTGAAHRASIKNLPSDVNFAIYKSTDSIVPRYQMWEIYTTDFPIDKLVKDSNGTIKPNIVYPIYKTVYRWDPNSFLSSKGKYTKQGDTEVGYAPSAVNLENTTKDVCFFNPKLWEAGNYIEVEEFSISGTNVLDKNNPKTKLTANILPTTSTDKSILWSSSNPLVADVDQNGVVTAYKAGEANIFARSSNLSLPDQVMTIHVNEVVDVKPSKITITGSNNVGLGESIDLKANVYPTDALNKSVTWSVSDTNVATIDQNGTLTAKDSLSYGQKVVVTATSKADSNIKGTYTVTISIPKSNPSYNGKPAKDSEGKVTSIPGKVVEIGQETYVYPDKNNNQNVVFSIEPTKNKNKAKVVIESDDPSAKIIDARYITTSNTVSSKPISLDKNKKGFTVEGRTKTSKTVYLTVSADKPVKVRVYYVK